jgi:drug/metabolite transporter (DMT)-like permease
MSFMKNSGAIKTSSVIGTCLVLLAAVAFALSNTSARIAFHGGSNPVTLAAVRFVLPAVVLSIWLTIQSRSIWLPRREGLIATGLGILTAAYSWALLSSIATIPIALAIIIFYLFPLVATVILWLFGWERLSWKTSVAICFAFIGLALALDPRISNLNLEGALLGLAAAIGLGVVIAVSSRILRTTDSRPVTLYMAAVSAVLLIALCAINGDFVLPQTTNGLVGFFAATLLYAFAMIAFFIAVSMIGATRSSLLCYAEPVFAAGLGVLLLGEKLTTTQIGGIVMVVGALVGASLLKQSSFQPMN